MSVVYRDRPHLRSFGISLRQVGFTMFLERDIAVRTFWLPRRGENVRGQAPVAGTTITTNGRSTGLTRQWRVVARFAAYLRGAIVY